MKLFPKSSIDAFGRWTYRHSWFSHLAESPSPDEMAESLTSDLKSAIDLFFPTKTVESCLVWLLDGILFFGFVVSSAAGAKLLNSVIS